jgi:hypothetical protein
MVIHFQSWNHFTFQPVSLLFKLLNFISFTSFVSFTLLTMISVTFSAFQILKHKCMMNVAVIWLATNLVFCSLMFYFSGCTHWTQFNTYFLLPSIWPFSFHVKYLGFHVKILHRMKQNSHCEIEPYEPTLPTVMISVSHLLWNSVL